MKKIYIYKVFSFLLLMCASAYSESTIAYVDMEFVFNNSIAGKKITQKLNDINYLVKNL